jgi:ribonucleoside-diphosphate reductase alpha chain
MVAAVQPFLSGGVSKTCNLPHDATVEDVEAAYILAWKLGLKSIAIYRDGCKGVQPVTVVTSVEEDEPELVDNPHWPWQHPALPAEAPPIMARSVLQRTHLPDERQSVTHKFSVGGTEGYLIVGLFPSGRPGELFVTMAKEGSTLSGLMDAFASVVSMALQYGMPLEVLVAKLRHTRYEPHGFTTNPQIRMASSLTDYIAQWLERKFISDNPVKDLLYAAPLTVGYGPFCTECAGSTVRNGSCWVCTNCGQTTGCS